MPVAIKVAPPLKRGGNIARSGMQRLAIVKHPQKERIDAAILSGESYRSIAAWVDPYVSAVSICKYGKGLRDALKIVKLAKNAVQQSNNPSDHELMRHGEAVLTKQLVTADPFLRRLEAKFERLDKSLPIAHADKDWNGASKLEGVETQALRLQAELEGRLQVQPSTNVTATLVIFGGTPATGQPIAPSPASEPGQVIDAEAIDCDSSDWSVTD